MPSEQSDNERTKFIFVSRDTFLSLEHMKPWQKLKDELIAEEWSLKDVLNLTEDILATYLVVSHRWNKPGDADPEGKKLKAIKTYLEQHPSIQKLWVDVCCMPQGTSDCSLNCERHATWATAVLFLISRAEMKLISVRMRLHAYLSAPTV